MASHRVAMLDNMTARSKTSYHPADQVMWVTTRSLRIEEEHEAEVTNTMTIHKGEITRESYGERLPNTKSPNGEASGSQVNHTLNEAN